MTLEGAARQVRPRDFEHYDLLLAMDRENLRELRTFSADGDAAGKARLLREFDPASAGAPDLDVPDPYYGGPDGFETVLDQVEAACRGLLAELRCGEPRRPRCAPPPAARCGRVERVGGGDINDAFRVQFADESFAFVKTRADVAPGEYAAEAAGLRWLAEPGALRVPEVLGVADDVLVLDWVDEGGRGDGAAFGDGLAEVHAAGADAFGGPAPLRLGSLVLPNDPTPDWPTFYAERRLLPLLEHAGLTRFGNRAVESVCARMDELAGPPEPPARLHGDLWSGNVLWGRDGKRVADRPRGLRRPPRGRPRDAAPVRLARAAVPRRLRGAVPARARPRGARRALPAVPAARARGAVRRRLPRVRRARGPRVRLGS